jgi:hypothetical protein
MGAPRPTIAGGTLVVGSGDIGELVGMPGNDLLVSSVESTSVRRIRSPYRFTLRISKESDCKRHAKGLSSRQLFPLKEAPPCLGHAK